MALGSPPNFLVDFLSVLREWTDDWDLTDHMLAWWIYMAEDRFNNELRVPEMVRIQRIGLADQCIPLPIDFLEIISVRYTGSGLPLRYVSPDEFWRLRSAADYAATGGQSTGITYLDPVTGQQVGPLTSQPAFVDYPGCSGPRLPLARNAYTFIGKTLFVHPTVTAPADGSPVELEVAYYGSVEPVFTAEAMTPLFNRGTKLYVYGTLAQSASYFIEDQRAQLWDSNCTALIKTMNDQAMTGRIAGSPITMQVRSFG